MSERKAQFGRDDDDAPFWVSSVGQHDAEIASFLEESSAHEAGSERLRVFGNGYARVQWLIFTFATVAFSSTAVCAFSWFQGNVWAPVFLLLDLGIVALALRHVYRRSQQWDELEIDGSELKVRCCRAGNASKQAFLLGWVKLECTQAVRGGCKLCLQSHGKSVEIGSFLNSLQRERLRLRLMEFLDLAKSRALSTL